MIGDVQIYLAHVGKDDYQTVKANREAFNLIVRYCGGIPQSPPEKGMCATLVFTSNLFREDFAREMREKINVTAVIDSRVVFVNQKYLPVHRNSTMDKYDFARLAQKAQYEKDMQQALHPELTEPEYVYPNVI